MSKPTAEPLGLEMLDVSNVSPGHFKLQPQRGLAGVGQGSRVNSCKINTKSANNLPISLERQVWASRET